jgi:hypothetical protein
MTSGFDLRTRTDALSNPRVRTAGVRAAYGTVRADYFNVVGSPGSRNNPLHMARSPELPGVYEEVSL